MRAGEALAKELLFGNYPLTVGNKYAHPVDLRLGGYPRWWLRPPSDINMRLPNQVLNTVCFIAHDEAEIRFGGTGFLVAIKGAHENAFLYTVTAKHVAEAVEHGPYVFGVNTKHGKKVILETEGSDPVKWYYHPTEPNAVDAAVTPFAPSGFENLDVDWVRFPEMVVTPESMQKYGIGIGDEIAVIGLFTGFSGRERHFPIARIGNLAMVPSERVPVKDFDPMEAYLAEGRSIGGLSGSPVYVRQTVNVQVPGPDGKTPLAFAATGAIFLLGLMHGHWDLPKGFSSLIQGETTNMGISIVVPAHKIMEILNHPELVDMRKKTDEEIAKENLPTPDSTLRKQKLEQVFTKTDFEAALKKASRKIKPKTK